MTSVKSMMTPNPACCTAQTTLHEVAKLMVDNDCGQIPVVESLASRKPVGVVTDRDIVARVVAKGLDTKTATAADCQSTPCVTVSDESSLADCCTIMEASQVRRVPVVDAKGCICGIVSLADLAQSGNQHKTAEVVKQVSAAR